MDASERLSAQQLQQADYLAASHLHRYELAAALCAGLRVLDVGCGTGYGTARLATAAAAAHGVDIDAPTIERAAADHRGATFATGDAAAVLRATAAEDTDAVVMFEALEHVPDPEAVVAELRRLRAAGVRVVVSVPNSKVFEEDNEFHVTDFDWTSARRMFEGLDGVLLCQHLAEGSLIAPAGGASTLAGEVLAHDRGEPEYANAYVYVAGFESLALEQATARLNLVAAPSHNRYMLGLERANRAFFSHNRQLARGVYGKHDAAAAAVIWKYEHRIIERDAEVVRLTRAVEALGVELARERSWRDAPRYHMVDRLAGAVRAVPGVSQLARAVWWVARRAFRRRPSGSPEGSDPMSRGD